MSLAGVDRAVHLHDRDRADDPPQRVQHQHDRELDRERRDPARPAPPRCAQPRRRQCRRPRRLRPRCSTAPSRGSRVCLRERRRDVRAQEVERPRERDVLRPRVQLDHPAEGGVGAAAAARRREAAADGQPRAAAAAIGRPPGCSITGHPATKRRRTAAIGRATSASRRQRIAVQLAAGIGLPSGRGLCPADRLPANRRDRSERGRAHGSRGRPRTFSPRMLRCTSLVPPPIVSARA